MSGEIITASTLAEAKTELRNIYKSRAIKFREISKEEYESIEKDQREDSDNHLNEEKLGKIADVIDLAYYKYLPDREIAYKIILRHKSCEEMEDYFVITPQLV